MSDKDVKPGWIDFKALKALADVDVVVEGFELSDTLTKKEDEWVGFCPFHPDKGKGDSFHFSLTKKAFHCFCCKRKGSVLDFAHQYMTYKGDSVDLRGAADWIQTMMQQAEYRRRKDTRAEDERQDLGARDAQEIAEASEGSPAVVDASGVFVDFAEACRLVTFGRAHVQDFVAVRVDRLLEVFGQLSPLRK
jgi:hypothetical protein